MPVNCMSKVPRSSIPSAGIIFLLKGIERRVCSCMGKNRAKRDCPLKSGVAGRSH